MAETTKTAETAALQRAGAPGTRGLPQQVLAMAASARQRFLEMPANKRNWLIVSLAFLAAGVAGMVWFAQRPDWRVLFSGLDTKDAQQISGELAAAGIPYEMTADGSGIQVPAENLDKARMEVAAKGMPQTGRLGFELFDKPNWVGSEFDERVNYQRALEGELEHTIGTISAVRSARVHLVLPQESLFANERKMAKASVVLKLKRASMEPEQAEAIRSLVSGSVENLNPEQVTLVDADGRVSMKGRSKDAVARDLEQGIEEKLVAMLEPLAGRDNVRASVSVTYDEGSEERVDEVYDPALTATMSLQKSDQTAAQVARAQGVPGTASNSPTAAPAGSVAGSQAAAAPGTPPLLQREALPVYPQNGGGGQALHQENGTYAVTKHTVHSEEAPGRIRRVSAAVLVNDRAQAGGGGGQTLWKTRSPEEMRRLEQLAQAAVGFDARRGDQVVVENVSFSGNIPEAKAGTMQRLLDEAKDFVRSQPGLLRTAMIGMGGLLLVLFVLRPVAQQATALLKEPRMVEVESPRGHLIGDGPVDVPGPIGIEAGTKEDERLEAAISHPAQQHDVFEKVSEHIRREPDRSTRLLEAWIGAEEGGKS